MTVLNCFRCDRELNPAFPESDLECTETQPSRATTFISYGQYGSTVFDPIDNGRTFLELNICDECLLKNSRKVLHCRKNVETTYQYSEWMDE